MDIIIFIPGLPLGFLLLCEKNWFGFGNGFARRRPVATALVATAFIATALVATAVLDTALMAMALVAMAPLICNFAQQSIIPDNSEKPNNQ